MSVINREQAIAHINEQKQMYRGDSDESSVLFALDMAIEILQNLDTPVGTNNYEMIRAMTVDEMAERIIAGRCACCVFLDGGCAWPHTNCVQGARAWLLKEVNEGVNS